MAVVSVTNITIRPGTYEAFLETSRKAKAVLERCGAKNFRVLGTLVAGEATASFATIWEADDHASYGAGHGQVPRGPGGDELLLESNSAEGPTAVVPGSLWSDIPM